jgi:hypothetical protein
MTTVNLSTLFGTGDQQGYTGSQGVGYTGSQGTAGASGASGIVGYVGSQGATGATGATGPQGSSSSLFLYRFDASIQGGQPTTGMLRWNSATQINSTQINIFHIDQNGVDIDIFLTLIKQGEQFTLQDENISGNYQTWQVSGVPVNVNPNSANSYWTYPVTLVISAGTGTSNFPNTTLGFVAVTKGVTGYAGSIGATGAAGYTGSIGYAGSIGAIGATGVIGYTGSQGNDGASGASGVAGVNGYSGSAGVNGYSGSAGVNGTNGYNGSVGGTDFVFQNVGFNYSVDGFLDTTYPDLTLIRGQLYYFNLTNITSSHPLALRLSSGSTSEVPGTIGNNPNVGVYGNGTVPTTVVYRVPFDAPSTIVYQCVVHSGMIGTINIVNQTGYTGSAGSNGYTGSVGMGFTVAKTYSSVALLNADTSPSGIAAGQFALIETGDAENVENSKLYVWTGSAYNFVTDLSGAAGITGPAGSPGYIGSRGDLGYTGSAGANGANGTIGTNGYVGSAGTSGYNGSVGYTGSTGATGTGYTGSVGYVGSMGLTGADGTQGGGYVNLTMSGPVSPPVTGTARFYSPTPMVINTIYANLSTSPTGGNLTFVIKKNGTSIGTVFQMPTTLMEPVSVSIVLVATDYLTLDVGGGSSADLNVKLKYI